MLQGVTLKAHFLSGPFFMAISNSMNFRINTLIDITETKARRQDNDKFAYKQQANFQTLLQTLGLRTQVFYNNSPSFDKLSTSKFNFSDKYIGKQNVWTFDFYIEYEDGLSLDMLTEDFDLIPIITGLNETIDTDKALFRTTGKDKNILFSVNDQGN
ncbi:hypothetical protein N9D61_03875 [Planktomarina sp.]|jgi:hypothetical protein|nr:hypothetical protein [Planktomarina sp.]